MFFEKRIILCLLLGCLFSSMGAIGAKKYNQGVITLPIVGGKEYDISFCCLEWLHPFDSKKYGKVKDYLIAEVGIDKDSFVKPRMVTEDELRLVHTQRYLASLKSSWTIYRITEIFLLFLVPNFILRKVILDPMKLATGGTIQAAKLALKHGWAINLGGGYHHAKSDVIEDGGYCVYADIPIAAHVLWKTNPDLKIMVIDLDAHQGNGHESVFKKDKRVAIFDVYNEDIDPWDEEAKKYITFNVPVKSGITGKKYMEKLKKELNGALDQLEKQNKKPDLIIFNAGTDPLDSDSLGLMKVSDEKMVERDEFVFEQAKNRNIPILYLFSGGYSKKSTLVVCRSLENILGKFLEIKKGAKIEKVPALF